MLRALTFSILTVASMVSHAGVIGLWGGSQFSGLLANSGHTTVNLSSSSTASDFLGLDQVWLIRQNGDSDLVDYVFNGGTLVTEWSGSNWALDTVSMIDANDAGGGFVATGTQVAFTQAGVDLGLGAETGNPYSNAGATQFFRTFDSIGSSVDVIATIAGRDVGVSGSYGSGNVIALGWDWQDSASATITQRLVNDISSISFEDTPVPEPSIIALMSLGLIGFFGMNRRKV